MTDTLYSGQVILRNWSETANGKRRIILEIEDHGGAHPFKGYEGERFMVAVAGPIANDETVSPGRGKAAGASTRKGEAGKSQDGRRTGADRVSGHAVKRIGEQPEAAHETECRQTPAATVTPVVGAETGGGGVPSAAPPAPKQKQRWADLRPSARAAMRVKDPEFWAYITEARGVRCETEHMADAWLKKCLNIESKSKLDEVASPSAMHFALVDSKFQAWLLARAHGQLER